MLEGRADFAVHSLKDMPMEMAPGFTIAAVPVREDPRDALVCNLYSSLDALPDRAVVGTSSLRREAQLRERRPNLKVKLLRGNVNTRIMKLDEGQYDAMILAAAGLNRLEQGHRASALLDPEVFLPAVGQGALALECPIARSDVIEWLAPLVHRPTLLAITAERAFRARCREAATRRSPATRHSGTASCGCADSSLRATAPTSCAANARRSLTPSAASRRTPRRWDRPSPTSS